MEYKIEIVEKSITLINIEADDRSGALKKAKEMYESNEIPFENTDYSYEINIV